ncbi:MAG: hypothetical protein SNH73_01540 [Rikenellaceae bacterium]
MKQNTEITTPAINDLNGLAGLFAAAVKNYNFGDDTNMQILERHSRLLETFMERFGSTDTRGIHRSLVRLVRCYSKHTTDSPEIQDKVMESADDICAICHNLTLYNNLIHEWEAVFSTMVKAFDNDYNENRDE